jgi:hypothetical protein
LLRSLTPLVTRRASTDASDDGYARDGARDEIRLGRVFDINAVPSRGDPQLRRVEKCVEVAKYQFVNLLFAAVRRLLRRLPTREYHIRMIMSETCQRRLC